MRLAGCAALLISGVGALAILLGCGGGAVPAPIYEYPPELNRYERALLGSYVLVDLLITREGTDYPARDLEPWSGSLAFDVDRAGILDLEVDGVREVRAFEWVADSTQILFTFPTEATHATYAITDNRVSTLFGFPGADSEHYLWERE